MLRASGASGGVTRRRAIGIAAAAAVLLAAFVAGDAASRAPEDPAVAAASDLNAALPEIAALFTRATGRRVGLTFGSSGNLTQQILNGAPFELFLSADEAYVEHLAAAGLTLDAGQLYAIGRIGIFAPSGSIVRADSALGHLAAALRDGRVRRFAIANPAHAPYGRAAEEALRHAGLWEAVRPVLVLGENATQATQFATTGGAEGGIIPQSLARTPAVRRAGTFALIPADRHRPLRQRAVLVRGAGETARAFHAFLRSAPARAVLARQGFELPPGEP